MDTQQFQWLNDPGPAGTRLIYRPWHKQGILHGFLGAENGVGSIPPDRWIDLFAPLGAQAVVSPKQVHGAELLELLDPDSDSVAPGASLAYEADGIIVTNRGRRAAFVIRSADCVPILLRAGSIGGLVHAGWRGLANGIIVRALDRIATLSTEAPLEVAIGPCAGPERYEVGGEVIAAIGAAGCHRPSGKERHLLSLAATAESIIRSHYQGSITVADTRICTISDPRFHSFRRDGPRAGRNLSFMIL